MKTNPHNGHVELRVWTRSVHYQWSLPDGTVCHGSTVVMSRNRSGLRQALRKFWTQHPHVAPDRSRPRASSTPANHHVSAYDAVPAIS